ncbi:hypothetical protein ABPG72_004548 [Tetrahymena utriculariae]
MNSIPNNGQQFKYSFENYSLQQSCNNDMPFIYQNQQQQNYQIDNQNKGYPNSSNNIKDQTHQFLKNNDEYLKITQNNKKQQTEKDIFSKYQHPKQIDQEKLKKEPNNYLKIIQDQLKQIQELNNSLNEKDSEIQKLKDLQKQIEELKKVQETCKKQNLTQVNELKTQITKLEKENKEQSLKENEQQQQIKKYQEDIASFKSEQTEFKKKQDISESQYKKQVEQLQNQIQDMEKQKQNQIQKQNQLDQKILKQEQEILNLNSQQNQQNDKFDMAQSQLSQQKQEFQKIQMLYENLQRQQQFEKKLLDEQILETEKQQKMNQELNEQLSKQSLNENQQQQQIKKYQEEIASFKSKQTEFKKKQDISESQYKKEVEQLQNQIQDMEKQKEKQIQKQNQLDQKIQEQEQEILNLNSQQNQQNDKFDMAQSQLSQQKQEFQKIKMLYENLERQQQIEKKLLDEQIKETEKQQKINQELNEQLLKYKQEYDIQNQYFPQKKIQEFGYDTIISMKSILDLQNKELDGYNQQMSNQISEQRKQEFVSVKIFNNDKLFDNNLIIVGMQGQRNQGKTFLLNSLIDENFPSEFYVNTPGICMKYNSIKDRKIIYVDSEGTNGPVQIDYEDNQNYQNLIRNQENNEQDDKCIQLVNKYVIKKHQYQKVTEQMQQEFVISNSHILIVMLTNITQEDVNLIHSIQSYLKKGKNSTQKMIFVIHNLKDFHRQECIEEYIQNLKRLFPLRQQQITTFKESEYKYNCVFIDTIYKNVNHLFMAYQKSQAGEIYNKFALDYLKEEIAQFKGEIKFNAVEKFQDYLNKNIQNYLILKIDDQQNANKDKELFEFNQEQKIIQLKKNCQIVQPKELQMDIFGYLQREFSYSIVKNGDKLYLLVDIPGPVDVKYTFKRSEGLLTLTINEKEQLEQGLGETIISTRKHDEIIQNFKICGKDKLYKISKNECKDLNNGIHQFVFIEEQDED